MKNILKILFLIGSLLIVVQANERQDNRWIIDAINKEKVLTQQMLKEYAFLGMGNKFGNSQKKLNTHLETFEEVGIELNKHVENPEAKKLLDEIKVQWTPIKEVFLKKPIKKSVAGLQKKIDKLLSKLSTLMKILSSEKSSEVKNIVNISSYQGVIIERMASLYMMKTWGVNDPKFNFKMRESITFFNNSMYNMLENDLTLPKNKKTIKRLMRSFKFFEIMNRSKTKFIPTLIYKKTEQIHKEIREITNRYLEGK